MVDDEFNLSRRAVLGGLGTVGVASAGAGLGTTAYFSDEETYTDNQVVAGELDMKVDWEEHYADWSADEAAAVSDVIMPDGAGTLSPSDYPADYVGLPDPANAMIAVPRADVGAFMSATAIEAFPDEDDDGQQDLIRTRDQISQSGYYTEDEVEAAFRAQFANVPAAFDSDLRTESSRGDPLIELDDVKPGDFGEVTFSLHLFNNPGYIWLDAVVHENAENGMTEPEAKDPDESGVNQDGDNPGELLDSIRALVWHDDGDNVLEPTETVHAPHDVDLDSTIDLTGDERIIARGSLREVLERAADDGIGLDADARTSERDCYEHSTTRYVCFAWWLPVDHANEIQTDSVRFDLGFYTEQCRHNDGSRMPETDA
jgi:predicted ribosomally synthesized peptide with SipW-like signal peptide